MEQKSQKHLKTGKIGENLAVQYLKKNKFKILALNYWKPCGEIDIIALKGENIHFVEVKTVTRHTLGVKIDDDYEPEDNVHLWKRQRLSRVIRVYLQERGIGEDSDWQVDLVLVYVNNEGVLLKLDYLEDIVL